MFDIIESIFSFFFELFAEALSYLFILKSKLEKNIDNLKNERWFSSLYEDYRYNYIIWQNRKVKRILIKYDNVELLIRNEQERERFINLVKQEHTKFVALK